ncbi:MAG: hypothetical protein INH43_21905 [Acidobacteriaceae bacterium]|jgi:hypothetical protein|nr:hypothetical protein [Acidobacteriaceae bacterium]
MSISLRTLLLEVGRISAAALGITAAMMAGKTYLLSDSSTHNRLPPNPPIGIGKVLSIDGKPILASTMSVVLLTSLSCRYSIDNHPKHVELARHLRDDLKLPLYRVDVSSRKSLLSSLALSPVALYRQMGMLMTESLDPSRLNLSPIVTPTIVILNHNGVIMRIFGGTLRARTQQPVLDNLLAAAAASVSGETFWKTQPDSIKEFTRSIPTKAPFVALDVRERDHFSLVNHKNVLNIPRDELEVRAPIELPPDREVVIDCTYSRYSECDLGVKILNVRGITATIEGHGAIESSCSYSPAN